MKMSSNKKLVCDRCSAYGLGFYAKHITPIDYIEGKLNAEIWIIGLNPSETVGHLETRTVDNFRTFNPESHSYFRDFEKVLKPLWENFKSPESKIAHTDLVKCFSKKFPPQIEINGQKSQLKAELIIENCKSHLFHQINQYKPKVIICNGSPVCWEMLKAFPPDSNEDPKTLTSYQATSKQTGHKFWIVLSGFIGRIDNRNKRRLGKEIEQILRIENIAL